MNYVIQRRYDNYVKAHIDKGMLEEASISCFLQDEYTVTIDPLLANAVGGIKLLVHEAQAPRAEAILRNAGEEPGSEISS